MIEIKPTRRLNSGYKLNKVYLNEKLISKGSDVIELRINDIIIKLDIYKDGFIRIWCDNGVFKNVGYIDSLSTDFKLIKKEEITND